MELRLTTDQLQFHIFAPPNFASGTVVQGVHVPLLPPPLPTATA